MKEGDTAVHLDDQKVIQVLSKLMHDYVFRLVKRDNGSFRMEIIAGRYEEVTGRSPSELSSPDDWYKALHEEDLPQLQLTFYQMVQQKIPVNFECRAFTTERELRWLEIDAYPEIDALTGEVNLIYGKVKNITSKKLGDQNIKESEERYLQSEEQWKSIIKTSPDGISIIGLDGKLLFVNDNLIKWHGYSRAEEMIGRNAVEFAAEDEREGLQALMSEVLNGNITGPFEVELITKNNTKFYTEINVELLRNQQGKPERMLLIERNITKRKEVEFANKQNQDELEFLNSFALKLSQHPSSESLETFLTDEIIALTEPTMLSYSVYNSGTSTLDTRIIKTSKGIFKKLVEVAGDRIHNLVSPVSQESYEKFISETVLFTAKSFTEVSFGAIPTSIDVFVRAFTGIDKFIGISLATGNELHAVLLLCFKKGARVPSDKLLHSFSNFSSIALKRKKAEDALIESNHLLEAKVAERARELNELSSLNHAIVNNAGVAVLSTDTEGFILSFNPAAEEMLGYSETEVVGKPSPLIFSDMDLFKRNAIEYGIIKNVSDPIGYSTYFDYVIANRESAFEWELQRKDGKKVQVLLSIDRLEDQDGIVKGYVFVGTDITARKKTEQALSKSVAENRAIIQAVPDLMFKLNREGVYLDAYSNPNSDFYVPREVFMGKQMRDVLPPVLTTSSYKALEEAFQSGKVNTYYYSLDLEGRQHHFENRISLIDDNEALSIVRDVTEQRNQEEALKKSEALFHAMFHEHTAVMMLIHPSTGDIIVANESAKRYYGYDFSGEEKVNLNNINTLSKNDLLMEMDKAVQKSTGSFVFHHKLASGEVRIVEVHSTPIEIDNDQLLFSVIHDITDRRLAEEALKASERTLIEITDNVPVFIALVNKDLEYQFVNSMYEQFFKLSKKEIIGKTVQEVVGKAAFEKSSLYLQKVLAGEEQSFANEVQNHQGEIRNVLTNYLPYKVDNEIVGILNTVIDVTEQKQAEQIIKWNESLLKKMTESSPLAFLVVDNRTDDIIYINHQFCEIWGIEHLEEKIRRKEVKNNDIIPDCIPLLKDVPAFAASCTPLQSEHNRIVVEDEIPFSDGRFIRRFSTQIRDEQDAYHGRLYIFEDITTRKNSEQLVRIQRDFADRLSTCVNLNVALNLGLDAFLAFEDIVFGGIYFFDPKSGKSELKVHRNLPTDFLEIVSNFDPIDLLEKMASAGEIKCGHFDEVFPGFIPEIKRKGIDYFLVLPVFNEGEIIASVNLGCLKLIDENSKLRDSLETISIQLAGAISRIFAEQFLISSQENFRLLFNTVDDFMFILDEAGHIILTNPIVESRLGYSREELVGKHVLEIHLPKRREEAGRIVNEMLEGTATYCPVPLYSKNGSEIPVETRVIKGIWDEKAVLLGISRDITERQKAEAALKTQSVAFESFALAIIITDPNGVISWANTGFTKLTGYSSGEILGRTNGELVKSGKQDKAFYKNLWGTIKKGLVWSGEIINKKKNGELYTEELTITPVHDYDGSILSFIAIKIDISERKAMELALRESEARWNFELEGSGDGVWDWNLETNEVYFSRQWKSMFGYTEDEIGNTLDEWDKRVYPEDKEACYADIEKHFSGITEVYQNEHRVLCKDRTYKWIFDRGKVVSWNEKGKPSRMIGTHTDITSRKVLEQTLLATIEKEKELNFLKNKFISIASHEFRNPLATIQASSESLAAYWEKMTKVQRSSRLEKIMVQVAHLNKYIEDMLHLTKMQSNVAELQPEYFDIVDLFRMIIEEISNFTPENFEFSFLPGQESLEVFMDKKDITKVFNNLLSNAIKYSPLDTKIEISILKDEEFVVFSVKDSGIGIPEEDFKHLFEPFFRASNVEQISGTGLGLNIIKEVIERHHGEVKVNSKVNEGTTFQVILPVNCK
jgi:PAS domain S-box-containing protein